MEDDQSCSVLARGVVFRCFAALSEFKLKFNSCSGSGALYTKPTTFVGYSRYLKKSHILRPFSPGTLSENPNIAHAPLALTL